MFAHGAITGCSHPTNRLQPPGSKHRDTAAPAGPPSWSGAFATISQRICHERPEAPPPRPRDSGAPATVLDVMSQDIGDAWCSGTSEKLDVPGHWGRSGVAL